MRGSAAGPPSARGSGPPSASGSAFGSGCGDASLEALVETGVLGLEVLHPGGTRTTDELAEMCGVGPGDRVLDVAGGTGETALRLAEARAARPVVVDASPVMVRRAREKLRGGSPGEGDGAAPGGRAGAGPGAGPPALVVRGDAHRLPFADGAFDVVLSECTLSLLRKREALAEMRRVVRPGGRVGFHEICWKAGAPEAVRARLAELEGERPETPEGWERLAREAGLAAVEVRSRPELVERWMREQSRELGLAGRIRALATALRRWGLRGLRRILASERLFRSEHLSYALVAGRVPESGPSG